MKHFPKIAIFLFSFYFLFSCSQKSDTIKIGASLPLSGNYAVYGRAIKNGMELANEELDSTFNIIYEDDIGEASSSVTVINKLINVDNVKIIIGGAMSSTAEPIIPITERSNVFLLSPTATKASLTENTDYFFRIWPSDNFDGKKMAEIAYNKLNINRIAILYVNVAYGLGIANIFQDEYKKLGGNVTFNQGYSKDEDDFRLYIEKIKNTTPQALYLPGYVDEVGKIIKQCKELNFKTEFLGVNSLYNSELLKIAGNAAEGAIFTYPDYDINSPNPIMQKFVNNFRNKYNSDPDVFAAQGYDAIKVLSFVIEKVHGINPEQIKNGFLKLEEYTGPGGRMRFLPDGNVEKDLILMTIKNGEFVNYME